MCWVFIMFICIPNVQVNSKINFTSYRIEKLGINKDIKIKNY